MNEESNTCKKSFEIRRGLFGEGDPIVINDVYDVGIPCSYYMTGPDGKERCFKSVVYYRGEMDVRGDVVVTITRNYWQGRWEKNRDVEIYDVHGHVVLHECIAQVITRLHYPNGENDSFPLF